LDITIKWRFQYLSIDWNWADWKLVNQEVLLLLLAAAVAVVAVVAVAAAAAAALEDWAAPVAVQLT
jgi:hypothetical protein